MAGIFISYRRDDTSGFAGRLYDRLCDRFGRDRVFRDVDTIEPGRRFPREIEATLARCDALVALIGPGWLTSADAQGRRRLDQADDFVRLEIATALRRGIAVVPALMRRVPMPRADELPADLAPLSEHQAIEIDDSEFHEDVDRLIEALVPHVRNDGITVGGRTVSRMAVAAAVGVVALGVLALAFAARGGDDAADTVALRAEPTFASSDSVRAIIIGRGYYSAATNPGGLGIAHAYRQQVAEGFAVVVDDATGLTWEQGGSDIIVQGGRAGAAAYARALNERRAAGYANWRLPTVDEALSLLTATVHADYHIDPAFAASSAPFIWTADAWVPDGPAPQASAGQRGWVVYYADGLIAAEQASFNGYVRAVRSN
jgi:hypothetical protein